MPEIKDVQVVSNQQSEESSEVPESTAANELNAIEADLAATSISVEENVKVAKQSPLKISKKMFTSPIANVAKKAKKAVPIPDGESVANIGDKLKTGMKKTGKAAKVVKQFSVGEEQESWRDRKLLGGVITTGKLKDLTVMASVTAVNLVAPGSGAIVSNAIDNLEKTLVVMADAKNGKKSSEKSETEEKPETEKENGTESTEKETDVTTTSENASSAQEEKKNKA